MRLFLIRHGEPDYAHDCLTPLGREQAKAAAKRLSGEKLELIYSSPNGRAQETARYTAEQFHLPIVTLPWMHEISWGGEDVPENGHPWTLGNWMLQEGFDWYHQDWRLHPYFQKNVATECFGMIAEQLDALLAEHGYVHDGLRFFCEQESRRNVALFSHGGSGACVLSHLLQLPFPYVSSVLPYDFTSIIIVNFPSAPGEYVFPRLELFNDCAHLAQDSAPVLQQKPDQALKTGPWSVHQRNTD